AGAVLWPKRHSPRRADRQPEPLRLGTPRRQPGEHAAGPDQPVRGPDLPRPAPAREGHAPRGLWSPGDAVRQARPGASARTLHEPLAAGPGFGEPSERAHARPVPG